jgi:putative CocE/NonD family hydrolase
MFCESDPIDKPRGLRRLDVTVAGIILLVILIAVYLSREGSPTEQRTYPMNVLTDTMDYTLYRNEEPILRGHSDWKADGAFQTVHTLTAGGQSFTTTLDIRVDDEGFWNRLVLEHPLVRVYGSNRGDHVRMRKGRRIETARLQPGTLLLANNTPALMSLAVVAYDQKAGGKQTFPVFIIPDMVMEASVEKLENVERSVSGRRVTFSLYRYSLPGVDVIVWVDGENRVCYAEIPAQHAAHVRDGYEVLHVEREAAAGISKPVHGVLVDSNVGVPMRDGVELATDIYRPNASGPHPVILVRTPYKKEMTELQARFYTRRGYVFAVQDCRGRFSSPGEWQPFVNEPEDGYDTVEWLARQPWSNGKVGMIGASYLGWTQWWAAREHPPHLVTIIPNVSPPDLYYNFPYERGAFFLLGAIQWANILDKEATGDLSGRSLSQIISMDYARLLRHLPVIELDARVLGKENIYWREWIAHPDRDDYWERLSFSERLADFDIPVYHQSGWFDGDGIGAKLNYLTMASHGHRYQKLVLGPWGHTDEPQRMGPNLTDFGPEATPDLQTSYLRWFDHWLKGVDNGIDKEPLVSVFLMGTNRWLHGERYPLPETRFTKYYLHSKGRARSSSEDGWLSTEPPGDGETRVDTYAYDPGSPTPDPRVLSMPELRRERSIDERLVKRHAHYGKVLAEREDILVYELPPSEESLHIAGPISAVLYSASSAKDTDWFMRLTTVGRDGEIFPLFAQGVIRARYRNSFSRPEPLVPDEIYEYHLDLWQTGVTIPPGGRLRVEVASAAFPTFSRNLNTGGHNETETEFVTAMQTIYHDPDHPSHVLLPVIPNDLVEKATQRR